MFESRGCAGRLQQLLAGLPPHEREQLLAELETVLATSGAVEGEYAEVIEAWLDGAWPPPESFTLGPHDDDPTPTPAPAPDPAAGPALDPAPDGLVSPSALRAAVVDEAGVGRLSADLTDDQVLGWIRRCTAVEQQAAWLRSIGVATLHARWTRPDPGPDTDPDPDPGPDAGTDLDPGAGVDRVVDGQADPARRARLRKIRRDHEGPLRRRAVLLPGTGPLPPPPPDPRLDPAVLAEAFVIAEVALATGTSQYTAGQWTRTGTALIDGHYPRLAAALRAGRLDWAKAHTIITTLTGRDPQLTTKIEQIVTPEVTLPDPVTGHGPDPILRTLPALRDRLRTLLLLLDPDHEDHTRATEREDRRVYARVLSPHTAELIAVLPIEQVALIAARLDAAAEQARRDRDPRTPDQVRADTRTDP